MREQIQPLANISPVQQMKENQLSSRQVERDNGFANALKSALDQVSKAEHASNKKTELLAQGKIDNLHDVMVTAQKATITIETAVQVQQKIIDAYNEMMRKIGRASCRERV